MNNLTLIDHFLNACTTHGSSIALKDKNEEVNYTQLKRNIESVSGFLYTIGIKAGDRVILVIDNSIEYVIAFYAVWKIGGIVVALNPQSKSHEIEKIITQCQANVLLTDKIDNNNIESFRNFGLLLIAINRESFEGVEIWDDALKNNICIDTYSSTKETPAQIIYTSGTTGDPKGVLLSHGNLICNTRDIVSYLKLTDNDSIVNVLPFHYSYGNSILHTHLYAGAKIILAGTMAFPQDIVNSLRKYEPTGFSGVPSTYNLLLSRSDWSENPATLRYITQAGGPMGIALTNQLLNSIHSDTRLFVMYGQTEATARITWLPPECLIDKMGSVGIALNNIQIEIRDDHGVKLDFNEKGGVYVRGDSVMEKYWNNSNATKNTLINDWLKTGDIGYLDNDGYLFLEGRNNDIIKVGAHRINPLELEEVINKLGFINESAVVGVEDEILGQKLRAFLVGYETKNNIFDFKKHCNKYLPAHKIPRDIEWVSQLPKTASGKIKRFQIIKINGDSE